METWGWLVRVSYGGPSLCRIPLIVARAYAASKRYQRKGMTRRIAREGGSGWWDGLADHIEFKKYWMKVADYMRKAKNGNSVLRLIISGGRNLKMKLGTTVFPSMDATTVHKVDDSRKGRHIRRTCKVKNV